MAVSLAKKEINVLLTKGFGTFYAQVNTLLQTRFATDRFDFHINNAGTAVYALFVNTTEAPFDEVVAIHVKGVYSMT